MIPWDPKHDMKREAEYETGTQSRRALKWCFLGILVFVLAGMTVLLVNGRLTPPAAFAWRGFSFSVLAVAALTIASVIITYWTFFGRERKPAPIEPWGEVVTVPEEIKGPEPCGRYMGCAASSPSPSSPPVQGGELLGTEAEASGKAPSPLSRPVLGLDPSGRLASGSAFNFCDPAKIVMGEGRGEGDTAAQKAGALLAIHKFAKENGFVVTVFPSAAAQRQAVMDQRLGEQIRLEVEAAMAAETKAAGGLH